MKSSNLKKNIHFLFEDMSIKYAINKLSSLKEKYCIVLDRKYSFKGTITDGDVRRGLLKGLTIKDEIKSFSKKKNFVTYKELSQKKINLILKKKDINFLPLLDTKKQVLDIYTKKKIESLDLDITMLIMAGGKGMRLRPLTNKIPKPMLLVNNRPLIENIIVNAKKKGISNFIISINYLGNKIKKYLKNGKKFGVKIKYLKETKPLGTAGSLSLIKNFDKTIILSNADIISDIDYYEMLNYHNKKKSMLTVSAKIIRNTINYGNLITKGSRISNIVEKPIKDLKINAGIYVISPKIKKFLKKNTYQDMTNLINLLLKQKCKVEIFPLHETWTDYGLRKNIIKHQV